MLVSVFRFLLVSILEMSLHFLLLCTGIGILKEIAKRKWKYERRWFGYLDPSSQSSTVCLVHILLLCLSIILE